MRYFEAHVALLLAVPVAGAHTCTGTVRQGGGGHERAVLLMGFTATMPGSPSQCLAKASKVILARRALCYFELKGVLDSVSIGELRWLAPGNRPKGTTDNI